MTKDEIIELVTKISSKYMKQLSKSFEQKDEEVEKLKLLISDLELRNSKILT